MLPEIGAPEAIGTGHARVNRMQSRDIVCIAVALGLLAGCAPPQDDPASAIPPATPGETTPAAPPTATGGTTPAASSVPLLEGGVRLPPVDEAGQNPSFSAFRERLLEIVRRRDAAALLAVVAPEIRFSFGEGGGRDAFAANWKLESGDSELWDELGRVLRLGGSFRDGRFVAPYTFSAWPESVDGFSHLAVVCAETLARAEPSNDAAPLFRLDHHVLPIGPEDPLRKGKPETEWRQVGLPDGRPAWVERDCLRSQVGYRASFERRDGEWMMIFFVAGD